MTPSLAHETITISRTIKASSKQVFGAWADQQARSVWGPPSEDEEMKFIDTNFRVGGKDVHVCGQKGDLRFRVDTAAGPYIGVKTTRLALVNITLEVSG